MDKEIIRSVFFPVDSSHALVVFLFFFVLEIAVNSRTIIENAISGPLYWYVRFATSVKLHKLTLLSGALRKLSRTRQTLLSERKKREKFIQRDLSMVERLLSNRHSVLNFFSFLR